MGSHVVPILGTDLEEIMATSRDRKELLWAWQGWRDAVGRQLRPIFGRYVQLSNKAARLNGEQSRRDMSWVNAQEGPKLRLQRTQAEAELSFPLWGTTNPTAGPRKF
jgi:hypothetical protein